MPNGSMKGPPNIEEKRFYKCYQSRFERRDREANTSRLATF